MENENCFDLEVAPDIICIEYGANNVEQVLYTAVGKPLVLPTTGTQTTIQKLGIELARRLGLVDTDPEKIHILDTPKGQMPFASPVYKTDPQRNVKVLSEVDTQMKIEWTDYRNNDPLYDFYAGDMFNKGHQYLSWGKTGKKLIGGLKGIVGTFNSNAANVEGGEMPSQIKAEFNWNGKSVPPRVSIP